jgi:hypothetical protein
VEKLVSWSALMLVVACSAEGEAGEAPVESAEGAEANPSSAGMEPAPHREVSLTLTGGMNRTFVAYDGSVTVEEKGQWYLAFGAYDESVQQTISLRLMLSAGQPGAGQEVVLEEVFPETSGLMMLEGGVVTNTVDGLAKVEQLDSSGMRVVFDAHVATVGSDPVEVHGVLDGDVSLTCIIKDASLDPDGQPGTGGTVDTLLKSEFCRDALVQLAWE